MSNGSTPGGAGALVVVLGPPLVLGAAGALLVPKHRVLGGLGGLLAGVVATQVYAYAVQKQSTAQLQQSMAAQATTFETGHAYAWQERVNPSIQTAADLAAALTATGWSNVAILSFKGQTPLADWPASGDPGLYVASGTWTGATMAVPVGTTAKKGMSG